MLDRNSLSTLVPSFPLTPAPSCLVLFFLVQVMVFPTPTTVVRAPTTTTQVPRDVLLLILSLLDHCGLTRTPPSLCRAATGLGPLPSSRLLLSACPWTCPTVGTTLLCHGWLCQARVSDYFFIGWTTHQYVERHFDFISQLKFLVLWIYFWHVLINHSVVCNINQGEFKFWTGTMNGEDDDLSFNGAGYSRPWHATCVPMKKKMDR